MAFLREHKTGNPELLQLCHASVERLGAGDVGGEEAGKGSGRTVALTSSKCDTASNDIMKA